jgi:hypothetical protein
MRPKIIWPNVGIVALAVAIGLIGNSCGSERPKEATANPYGVVLLFEHEGCRVYRFLDDNHYRYFVNCGGHTASTSSEHREAKFTRQDSIITRHD